ncbi:mannose-6-phosphate isomerase [Parelusimicrobium proximum]|uniref:type I phosphomannose isomerase catalytic subunit n=1 Tax=Parelusimicrobium proximum TaxID=3228953 RepID=UPI003D165E8B
MYPIKFTPIFKTMIWGGSKLKEIFNKNIPAGNTGESWEISGVKGNISTVSNGEFKGQSLTDLLDKHGAEIMGADLYKKYGAEFPLLIKLIDARDNLSVQVHPDDAAAKKLGKFGKTEMWYILSADSGAKLISGFKNTLTKNEYKRAVAENTILDSLACYEVRAGEAFLIPAGRVHAIGRGILLAEVQQTSDITYRIYDYNRTGPDGKPRQLHTEEAAEVINLSDTNAGPAAEDNEEPNTVKELCSTKFFTVSTINVNGEMKRDYRSVNSFIILMSLEDTITIEYAGGAETLKKGETCLIPFAVKDSVSFKGRGKLLESYV